MPTFAYEAMNSSGQEVKDEVEANTSEEALLKSATRGFFPTKVRGEAAKKAAKKKEMGPVETKRRMPISIGGVPRKQLVALHPPALHAARRRPADPS